MALEIQKNGQNVILRNLQEQVQKNKEDIAAHYAIDRAMSNLGIKVVGQVSTAEELPDPETYFGEFGDAYAVGDKEAVDAGTSSYDYYVYTRPDPNAGQYGNYWLNVGKISIAGPQGVQGIPGPKGNDGISSKWYAGVNTPGQSSIYKANDMFLNTETGYVFQYNGTSWVTLTNITGPQGAKGDRGERGLRGQTGPVGPKGEKGDVAGFINIIGILENAEQLPTPESINNLSAAYLIGTSQPYDLYIQVGATPATAEWNNTGGFNIGTYVTSGGEYQNIWDADSKQDVIDEDTHISIGSFDLISGVDSNLSPLEDMSYELGTYEKFWFNVNSAGYAITSSDTGPVNDPDERLNVSFAYLDDHRDGDSEATLYLGATGSGEVGLSLGSMGRVVFTTSAYDMIDGNYDSLLINDKYGSNVIRIQGEQAGSLTNCGLGILRGTAVLAGANGAGIRLLPYGKNNSNTYDPNFNLKMEQIKMGTTEYVAPGTQKDSIFSYTKPNQTVSSFAITKDGDTYIKGKIVKPQLYNHVFDVKKANTTELSLYFNIIDRISTPFNEERLWAILSSANGYNGKRMTGVTGIINNQMVTAIAINDGDTPGYRIYFIKSDGTIPAYNVITRAQMATCVFDEVTIEL